MVPVGRRELLGYIVDLTSHSTVSDLKPLGEILDDAPLVSPDLREAMDLRVFVDTEADLRVLRRVERDMRERGRSFESVVAQYHATVRPMHDRFVTPSKQHADLIIPGGHNRRAVGVLVAAIRAVPG